MKKEDLKRDILRYLKLKYCKEIYEAKDYELFNAISLALIEYIVDDWNETKKLYSTQKNAYYLSAEYLIGRALGNNLISLGLYDEVKEVLKDFKIDINKIENIEEDAGLGNGGLGRLAACFMDSAASMELPLMGYGIRYSNGLFKQDFKDGFQIEEADNWLKYGEPWSIRKADEALIVEFDDGKVKAVPYDTPIIGYKSKNINTLRLWKCEPLIDFDFNLYNDQKYNEALSERNRAEDVSRVLYPNDSTRYGKLLRLKQQYFLVSASLQDIIRNYKKIHRNNFEEFSKFIVIQLNDTHPVLAIPELLRLLVNKEGLNFNEALSIAKKVFGYTNHTILKEALEKWDKDLIMELFPGILDMIEEIDERFIEELKTKEYDSKAIDEFRIINGNQVRMANLAIYISSAVNGVAKLHTEILKNVELHSWYQLYPEKFQNKTNGITPRRWIRLCNKELSSLITELLGNEDWVKNLSKLKELEEYQDNEKILKRFMDIKREKKVQLAKYIKENEDIEIDPNSLFDIQIKRLHEYKRQLLNALYILDLYFRLKENKELDIPNITFIFGAKAFPGYERAKAIIKFINEIANLINNDEEVNKKIKVVFVRNYKVSYAEKLFPAADISKQISTAGKEASGTGNMKFMVNGALTFGTYDGANVEIVKESGDENNFIFGLRVEEIDNIKETYSPRKYYRRNLELKRVLDTLVDGTFDDEGTGMFKDLYNSLLKEGDQYFILADFESFKEEEEKVFKSYKDELGWAKKCFLNMCNSGNFSSDRTILEYSKDIWGIKPCKNN